MHYMNMHFIYVLLVSSTNISLPIIIFAEESHPLSGLTSSTGGGGGDYDNMVFRKMETGLDPQRELLSR